MQTFFIYPAYTRVDELISTLKNASCTDVENITLPDINVRHCTQINTLYTISLHYLQREDVYVGM